MNDAVDAVSEHATPGPPDDPLDAADGSPAALPWWKRIDRATVVVTGIVTIGLLIIVQGVLSGVTGDDRAGLPERIEEVQPVPDAVQVLGSSTVFVDLVEGYTGVLVIDGVEIDTVSIGEIQPDDVEPGTQVELPEATIFEPGNHTLTFVPSAGAPIEEFEEGRHEIELVYWEIDVGRERARSFTWSFDAV